MTTKLTKKAINGYMKTAQNIIDGELEVFPGKSGLVAFMAGTIQTIDACTDILAKSIGNLIADHDDLIDRHNDMVKCHSDLVKNHSELRDKHNDLVKQMAEYLSKTDARLEALEAK